MALRYAGQSHCPAIEVLIPAWTDMASPRWICRTLLLSGGESNPFERGEGWFVLTNKHLRFSGSCCEFSKVYRSRCTSAQMCLLLLSWEFKAMYVGPMPEEPSNIIVDTSKTDTGHRRTWKASHSATLQWVAPCSSQSCHAHPHRCIVQAFWVLRHLAGNVRLCSVQLFAGLGCFEGEF